MSSVLSQEMRNSDPRLHPRPIEQPSPPLRPDRSISLALGGGAVRGLAHVGVLEVLTENRIPIREIVGTSVGALILAFYAAVGMELDDIRAAGLRLKSYQLLAWALLRHAPATVLKRLGKWAGEIPFLMQRLQQCEFAPLHHGVERIGIIAFDQISGLEVVCHSESESFRLEDAVRGSAALPGLFPAWKCRAAGRLYRLQDGGVVNCLPVDILLRAPFRPEQVLAVDISSDEKQRQENLAKINDLRQHHPTVPIDVIAADTIGGASVLYAPRYAQQLVEAGRRSALEYLEKMKQCSVHTDR
jgi:NTE family protein